MSLIINTTQRLHQSHLCGYGGGVWRKQWLLEHERQVVRQAA